MPSDRPVARSSSSSTSSSSSSSSRSAIRSVSSVAIDFQSLAFDGQEKKKTIALLSVKRKPFLIVFCFCVFFCIFNKRKNAEQWTRRRFYIHTHTHTHTRARARAVSVCVVSISFPFCTTATCFIGCATHTHTRNLDAPPTAIVGNALKLIVITHTHTHARRRAQFSSFFPFRQRFVSFVCCAGWFLLSLFFLSSVFF